MKRRTLSIGGATVDLFVCTEHDALHECHGSLSFALPLGGKVRVRKVIETCGGGAANTSVGLSRLGCQASFEGVIGSDQWGQKLLENFRRENVDTSCATIVEGEVTSFSIILLTDSGERSILYTPGTNAHLDTSMFDREKTASVDWVYLNHIQPRSCIISDDIAQVLSEYKNVRLTWNPGGCQIEEGLAHGANAALVSKTSLLLLNREEALAFTGRQSTEDALRTLVASGAAAICVTDGPRGTVATDGKTLYRCPALETNVLDTTGAGDAFGTAATWALLGGRSLPEALRAGTINAARVVSAYGAQAGLLTETALLSELESRELPVDAATL